MRYLVSLIRSLVTPLLLVFTLMGSLAMAEPKHVATVNINTANAETMASALNGVGLSKAEAIVAYRSANGNFKSADDLGKVKGIGASTVDKNRGKITLK